MAEEYKDAFRWYWGSTDSTFPCWMTLIMTLVLIVKIVACRLLRHLLDHCRFYHKSAPWYTIPWRLFQTKMSVLWQRGYKRFNSLAPGRWGCNLKFAISIYINNRYPELFMWNCSQVYTTRPHWWLVYISAWCHQATNYWLNQCWPRSVSPPKGVTGPMT